MPLESILSPRNGRYLGQVLADYLMHQPLIVISVFSVKSCVIRLLTQCCIQ